MNLVPIADRVLVEPFEQETVLPSGLVLPDTAAKDKPQIGTVIAVGPGRKTEDGTLIPMSISAGDTVLFGKWAGIELEIENQTLLVLREVDLICYDRKEGSSEDGAGPNG